MSHITEITQPGVSFTQQIIDISRREKPTALPVFVGYSEHESACEQLVEVGSQQEFYNIFGKLAGPGYLLEAIRLYFSHGGGQCYVFALPMPMDKTAQAEDYQNIAEAIASEPAITLIVIPDIVLLDLAAWQQVVVEVGKCCEENINLFALIDFPSDPQQAEEYSRAALGDNTRHMAGYWPWVMTEYEEALRLRSRGKKELLRAVPPCAAVAAAMQNSDKKRGIWRAPANIRLEKVIKPEFDHLVQVSLFSSDPRKGVSVNQIRSFPGRGIKIWGCRTLSRRNDIYTLYVQNQRLMKWIKSTLSNAMQPYVFEQNNEITWYRLHAVIRQRLKSLWERGGLAGATEQDAFRILVGLDESMTAEDIAQGLLRCQVSVALQQPAEFVHINMDLWLGAGTVENREMTL